MATPEREIPLQHLPLDVLRRQLAHREAAQTVTPINPPTTPTEVDRLLASVGLEQQIHLSDDLEPLRAELARRLQDDRETARLRAALYRSHRAVGLLEYRAKLTKQGLEAFILDAGERLFDETGAPPVYLLVPPTIYHRHLIGIYNVFGAALTGQPLVLQAPFGVLKALACDLVQQITLV